MLHFLNFITVINCKFVYRKLHKKIEKKIDKKSINNNSAE